MRTAPFLPLLALAACAPSEESGEERRAAPSPFGFELAAAQDAPAPSADVVDLSVAELAARMNDERVRLIDVRTDAEVAQGMIPGAEHVALAGFDPAALDLGSGETAVLYCRSGRRSAKAAAMLSRHTGEPALHLAGGILAWQEAGGETISPE